MAATNNKEDVSERTFEHKWVIPNWNTILQNEPYFSGKTEYTIIAENVAYAEVSVGFLCHSHYIGFNGIFEPKHYCLDDAKVYLLAEIHKSDGTAVQYAISGYNFVERTFNKYRSVWESSKQNPVFATDPEGSLEILLKCTLKHLSHSIRSSEIEDFRSFFKAELGQNLAAVLEHKVNSDVKILTKDNIEIFAHKNILQARCPYFASMFGSNFVENSTGIVNSDDISSKTMKILLNYWYTGELLPSWKDEDTVFEFTYAAGKYQISQVLKMLNQFLGREPKYSDMDIDLLKITQELSLENAKARLLKRVIHKCKEAKTGAEILEVFSIPIEKFDGKSVPASHIFQAWNDDIRENDDGVASQEDIKSMAWACSFGMKNVEAKMLKRVIRTVSKFRSAEELFALFDLPKVEHDRVSVSDNLSTSK